MEENIEPNVLSSVGWTVDTLHLSINMRLTILERTINEEFAALYRLMDERHHAMEKASDLATVVQQTAMRAALEAADKGVSTALVSAEKAVFTAMTAAEKAVNKAEIASEKRFESVNEFRGQLADQASTFMPRSESQVSFTALESKLATHIRTSDIERAEIRSRLDLLAGGAKAEDTTKADLWRLLAFLISAVAVIATVYSIVKP